MNKRKRYIFTEEAVMQLQVIAFMLETEAENLKNVAPGVPASELTIMSAGTSAASQAKSWHMLIALAQNIRAILKNSTL